jgi:hypothetical protein
MTWEVVVAVTLLLVFLAYGLWAFQRLLVRHRSAWGGGRAAPGKEVDAASPLRAGVPAHGAWVAVRSRDAEAVLASLGITMPVTCPWPVGLQQVRQRGLAVLPAIDGWVLVSGRDLVPAPGAEPVAVFRLLVALSRQFGCAQWFLADAEQEQYGWAVAFAGDLQRAYAVTAGELPWSEGKVTVAEHQAGCFVRDPRDQSDDADGWWPDQECVRQLAAAWSRDPWLAVPGLPPAALAWLGHWRA